MLTLEERAKIQEVLNKTRTLKINNVDYVPAKAVEIMLAYFTDKDDNIVRMGDRA